MFHNGIRHPWEGSGVPTRKKYDSYPSLVNESYLIQSVSIEIKG